MKFLYVILVSLSMLLNSCHLTIQSKAKGTPSSLANIEGNAVKAKFFFLCQIKIDSLDSLILYSRDNESFYTRDTPLTNDTLRFVPLNYKVVKILTDTNFMAFNNDYGNKFLYSGAFRNGRRIDTFQLRPINENKHRLVEVFDSLGLRHGYYTAYDTLGKPIHRGYFEHGTGYDKEFWYDTRGIRQKGRYVKGYKTGVWYYYDRHSKLRRKEYYEMGKLMKAVEVQQR